MVDFNNIIDYFTNGDIPPNMLKRGQLGLNNFLNPMKILFEQKAVPQKPWTDGQIDYFLQTLSYMDTDKDDKASRVGEREARIASKLHLKTSAGFCHGIGRSGFLTAPQPKAPGASIMYELANYLARDFLRKFGLPNIKKAMVVPLCTGMTLALTLAALRPDWNDKALLEKRNVILPQLDHNSILKSLDFVGVGKKIVEGKIYGDAVRVPIEEIKNSIDETCYAVISFTSFFPPRENDDLKEISKIAKKNDLVHIIINAYGIQSLEWMRLIRSAMDAGRVDAVIQSTDKNILTPVGGAILASNNEQIIEQISKTYAGRASASPIVDFIISILALGVEGYQNLIKEQQENRVLLEDKLKNLASKINERVLEVFNPVAVAMSLTSLKEEHLFELGGALYNLRVTGPRVYNPSKKVFGTCCKYYKTPYIVMNAAIGATREDIITAVNRFEKAYRQITQ